MHAARVRLKRARMIARIGGVGAPGLAGVLMKARGVRLMAAARETLASLRAMSPAPGLKAAAALNAAANYETPPPRAASNCAGRTQRSACAGACLARAVARQIARGRAGMRRAERAREAGLDHKHQAARHRWRRREKERLYAAEALGADWPGPRRRNLAARLCDALGKERDALILLERLISTPLPANAEPTPKRALKALKARAKHWRKRSDKLGAKLARALA